MKNKKWVKPQLIILVRGDSGELVLAACKSTIAVTPTPSSFDTGCLMPFAPTPPPTPPVCGGCNAVAAS